MKLIFLTDDKETLARELEERLKKILEAKDESKNKNQSGN